MKWPALPKVVDAMGGTVKVRLVKGPLKHDDGTVCSGLWDAEKRQITVVRGMPPLMRWRVFFHELAHVALTDAGLDNAMDERVVEAICDAMANTRCRERFGAGTP